MKVEGKYGICLDCKHFKTILERDRFTIVGYVCGCQSVEGVFIETAANKTCVLYEPQKEVKE